MDYFDKKRLQKPPNLIFHTVCLKHPIPLAKSTNKIKYIDTIWWVSQVSPRSIEISGCVKKRQQSKIWLKIPKDGLRPYKANFWSPEIFYEDAESFRSTALILVERFSSKSGWRVKNGEIWKTLFFQHFEKGGRSSKFDS